MFAAASVQTLSVIDPCNRTGKINIPTTYVTETKGVTDFLRYAGNPPPEAKDLSLCLLFQKGRCNAGNRCNQVHATPEFVEQLRARANSVKSCCARHGDVHSEALDAHRGVVVLSEDGLSKHYTLADFAFTPALELAVKRTRAGAVRVQATRVCRLHSRGSCKFGRDCKNVHLCPRAVELESFESKSSVVVMPTVPMPVTVASNPPALGLAFRAVPVCCDAVGASDVSVSGDYGMDASASRSVPHLSILSIMSEFKSMRAEDADPLELLDNESSYSSVVSGDFDAFVDALVEYDVEPMASPQWLMVQ